MTVLNNFFQKVPKFKIFLLCYCKICCYLHFLWTKFLLAAPLWSNEFFVFLLYNRGPAWLEKITLAKLYLKKVCTGHRCHTLRQFLKPKNCIDCYWFFPANLSDLQHFDCTYQKLTYVKYFNLVFISGHKFGTKIGNNNKI